MFKDEEIIEQRYWERRKVFTGIDTGIYSGEELLKFCEVLLFENSVGVVLPTTFLNMLPNEAEKKYPSGQRPQIIKTNEDGTVNFVFNLIEQKMEIHQLEEIIHDFVRVMKRLYPTNICLDIKKGVGINLPYASMEFTSMAVNENLYNMLIVSLIGEKLLMMLFNCPFRIRNEWSFCLSQIRENIADYSKEGKNEAN